jgi:hypothetical protein
MSPLELDWKYNYINKGFRESNDYNELVGKIRVWVRDSLKPRLRKFPEWNELWVSDDYFENAYDGFKRQFYPIDFKAEPLKMI